jgi:heptosyltransferase-1
MRILLIKTSSLGDIIHTFPALTDAQSAIANIRFDWLVEEGFTELPALHSAVDNVIALPWRRLRKRLWSLSAWRELRAFVKHLNTPQYDLVIDAQGLLKSAIWTAFIDAPVAGLDKNSAREPLSARWYDHAYPVAWQQHAIDRVRLLFAQALGYATPNMHQVDYALQAPVGQVTFIDQLTQNRPYWAFAHATTWDSKHWPEIYWHAMVAYAAQHQRIVLLPWHSEEEKARAQRFARLTQHAHVLPACSLTEMAEVLSRAELVIGVDTGLTHLAAALHTQVIALYGATEPGLTGVVGPSAHVLQATFSCAPCFNEQCIELTEDNPEYPPCYLSSLTDVHVKQLIEQVIV